MNNTNIFRYYSQDENRYTNGLISLLKFGSIADSSFLRSFFETLTNIELNGKPTFKVLREYNGTADAEILSGDTVILLETKIVSGTLRKEQIKRHLATLNKYPQKTKNLILLTPDSVGSHYMAQFLKLSPSKLHHLNWGSTISFLKHYNSDNIIFSEGKSCFDLTSSINLLSLISATIDFINTCSDV